MKRISVIILQGIQGICTLIAIAVSLNAFDNEVQLISGILLIPFIFLELHFLMAVTHDEEAKLLSYKYPVLCLVNAGIWLVLIIDTAIRQPGFRLDFSIVLYAGMILSFTTSIINYSLTKKNWLQ